MKMKKNIEMFNNENIHNVLRSTGYIRDPQDANLLEMFYSLYNTTPFTLDFDNYHNFYWDVLLEELTKAYPDLKVLYQDKKISLKHKLTYFKQETFELKEGLILHLEGDLNNEQYLFKNKKDNVEEGKKNVVTFTMFLSVEELGNEEHAKIIDIFSKSKMIEDDVVNIGMVSMDSGQYYVKDFNIKEKILDLQLLDLHYGDGFEEFNNELIHRLLTKTKGLTLLHGEPGTGKCVVGETKIQIRNKNTNVISEINIEDLM